MTRRAAVGLVIGAEGRLLFARRVASARRFPDLWEFPGGELESGESFTSALHRELEEELAITVQIERPLLRSHPIDDNGESWEVQSFVCRYVGGEMCVAIDELAEADYFPADEPPTPLMEAAKRDLDEWLKSSDASMS